MSNDVAIYRPNKDKSKGFAMQWSFGTDRRGQAAVYVEAVNQTGEKPPPGSTASPFNWKEKINMMLNVNELADAAAYIRGYTKQPIKFVHSINGKSSYLNIARPDPQSQYDNWSVQMAVQKDGKDTKVSGFISPGQVYHILSLLDFTIQRSFTLEKKSTKQMAAETSVSNDSGV